MIIAGHRDIRSSIVRHVRSYADIFMRSASLMFLRSASLMLVGIAWLTFDSSGVTTDAFGFMYARFHYWALPMALSVAYRGWPLDFTLDSGVKALVWQQPLDQPLSNTMKNVLDALPSLAPTTEPAFWMVDDRGLGVFTIAAFQLFGPQMSSLSVLWFGLLLASTVIYLLAAGKSVGALACGFCWLLALAASPGIFFFTTGAGDVLQLHLTESRLFTLLAVLPAMGALWLALSPKPLTLRAAALAWTQIAFIAALTTVRSTVAIYLLAIVIGASILIILRFRSFSLFRSLSILRSSSITPPLIVLAGACLAFIVPPAIVHSVENPDYAGVSQRTFWHNALMGFSYSPSLAPMLNMIATDHAPISLVLAWRDTGSVQAAGAAVRASPEEYVSRAQVALNWDDSTRDFGWEQYERDARTVFWTIFAVYPQEALATFALHKPRSLILALRGKVLSTDSPTGLLWPYCAAAAAAALVGFVARVQINRREGLSAFAVLLTVTLVSSIPALAFYEGSTQNADTLVLIGTLVGFGSLLAGGWIRDRRWRISRWGRG